MIIALGALWYVRETSLRRELAQSQERQAALQRQEQELQQQIAAQRGNIEQLNSDLDRARQQRKQIEDEMNRSRQSTLASVIFTFGVCMSRRPIGEAKTLEIPAKTDVIGLQVPFESNEYTQVTAVLRTLSGEQVWSKKSPKSQLIDQIPYVTFEIPAARLSNRDYHLTLTGATASGETEKAEYYFRVRKK